MTDKAPERIWMHAEAVNQEAERFWVANRIGVGDFKIGYIRADIHQALEAERDELAAALDSEHAVVGSNIWRFWSKKACETADRNLELIAERDRLRGALDGIVNSFNNRLINMDSAMESARTALEGKQ